MVVERENNSFRNYFAQIKDIFCGFGVFALIFAAVGAPIASFFAAIATADEIQKHSGFPPDSLKSTLLVLLTPVFYIIYVVISYALLGGLAWLGKTIFYWCDRQAPPSYAAIEPEPLIELPQRAAGVAEPAVQPSGPAITPSFANAQDLTSAQQPVSTVIVQPAAGVNNSLR
jgi:hypothetical protein